MKRRRDDSVKPGKGIDDGLGENFSRQHRVSPWDRPTTERDPDSVGPIDDESQMPARDANRDIQFMWGTRQIWQDVEANQRPNGEFDSTGPIKAGVNRKQ